MPGTHRHIRLMDFDISHLLDQWEYQPGQVVARRFKTKRGTEKIQLRLDLGLLQMNAEGRPDGKRPFGYVSLIWAVLIGMLVFGDQPDGFTLAGGAMVAAAGGMGLWYWWTAGPPPVRYITMPVDRGPITAIVTATGRYPPVSPLARQSRSGWRSKC